MFLAAVENVHIVTQARNHLGVRPCDRLFVGTKQVDYSGGHRRAVFVAVCAVLRADATTG